MRKLFCESVLSFKLNLESWLHAQFCLTALVFASVIDDSFYSWGQWSPDLVSKKKVSFVHLKYYDFNFPACSFAMKI